MISNRILLTASAIAGVLLTLPDLQAQRAIFTLTGQTAGDHFGWSVREAGDVNVDGFPDFIVGAPFDDTAGTNAGSISIFSGKSGAVLQTVYGAEAGDCFGFAVSSAGDVNRDGRADLIVGAPGRARHADRAGKAVVVSGLDYSTLYTFLGSAVGDRFGYAVNGAGDVDNDGFPDVMMGAPGVDDLDQGAGYVHVRSGRTGAIIFNIPGNTNLERFGYAVSGFGDADGDGHADFIVGAPLADPSEIEDAGQARQYSGRTGALIRVFDGILPQSHLGSAVRAAGDVNGDMIPDYIIGARFERDRGQAHIISGADSSTIRTILGNQRGMWFGQSVSAAGDIDGDGFGDVIVGAPIAGDLPILITLTQLLGSVTAYSGQTGNRLFEFKGPSDLSWLGWSVSGAGDINKDGYADIVVGTPLADEGKGQVTVVSGRIMPMYSDTHELSVSAPGLQTQNLTLAAPTQVGRAYLVLGSATGIVPGFTFGGVQIPLNPDGWLGAALSFPNVPPFINTFGVLDGLGRGNAAITLPGNGALSVLSGLTLHHAFVTFQAGSIAFSSNAVPLTFTN